MVMGNTTPCVSACIDAIDEGRRDHDAVHGLSARQYSLASVVSDRSLDPQRPLLGTLRM